MINSVSSASAGMQAPMARSEQNLTADQQKTITETLTQFDPDSLSESDALSIIESLSSAGIQPGKGLESAMSELGFDAKSIGELAGVDKSENGHRPPPPPKQSSEEITELVDYLTELLEEKLATSSETGLSDEERLEIYVQVNEKFGTDSESSIINTTA